MNRSMRPYSEAVKAEVRRKMSPPYRQIMAERAPELGMHLITLTIGGRLGGCRGR